MDKIKLVLVDDHQMFRDGVKSVLSEEVDIELLAELGHADELFKLLTQQLPDLIITDLSLPEISGIEITKRVAHEYPQVKILILSMHSTEEFILNSVRAGAHGYLPKDTGIDELLMAIRAIHQGETYFNKRISDTLIKSISQEKTKDQPAAKECLTSREKEIIQHVVGGLTNKEIADRLFISIRTVDSHKNNIMHKLNLKSTVDLVKFALKNQLAELD